MQARRTACRLVGLEQRYDWKMQRMTTVPCNPAFGQDPAIGDGSDFTARRQKLGGPQLLVPSPCGGRGLRLVD